MPIDVLNSLIALSMGLLFALILLAVWIKSNGTTAMTARSLMHEAEETITFLFEDEVLLDATPRARDLLSNDRNHSSDWDKFLILLSGRFPHLRSQLSDLASVGKKSISPEDGQPGWLQAEHWNGLSRLTLVRDKDDPAKTIDPLTAAAMENELQTLRSIGEDSPQLIWKRDAAGVLIWANRAYIELSEQVFPIEQDSIRPWPPNNIFPNAANPAGTAPIIDMQRVNLPDKSDPIWYEVTSLKRGYDTIHFAIDASAIVAAGDAQRNFVQTLTKTFAQLSVGLAIFDSERRLVLFNPAIVDLTTLSPDFLIARPTLFSFLDRLRDQQMIPEPKNYNDWRENMIALESAAVEGNYYEAWLLPNGQTYRVTGKPHPDGAIAFLIEDISDEISLTRKFRSQIDIGTAVLDNLTTAVAVFSSAGSLILVNSAYRSLWGRDLEGSLSNPDMSDEIERWKECSAPSPVWVKLENLVTQGGPTTPWDGNIWLENNVEIFCRYTPLPDGNHQITFSRSETVDNIETRVRVDTVQESISITG